jgi:predicted Zn-dependent protease
MKKYLLIALFGATLLFTGCSKAPMTDRNQFIILSPSQEVSLGLQASQEVMKENKDKLNKDAALVQRIRTIGTHIAKEADFYVKQAGLPAFEWEFHLIEDDLVNAFCLPGGKVFVYSGLMKAAKNDAQLATVIAHEIAHAIARHGAERMSTATAIDIGGMIIVGVAAGSEKIDKNTMVGISVAYGIGSGLGKLKHSRVQESEADYVGLMIMAKAGYDPKEALAFWENMKKENEKQPMEFLSTHPLPDTRIKDIKNIMPEATKYYEKSEKRF